MADTNEKTLTYWEIVALNAMLTDWAHPFGLLPVPGHARKMVSEHLRAKHLFSVEDAEALCTKLELR